MMIIRKLTLFSSNVNTCIEGAKEVRDLWVQADARVHLFQPPKGNSKAPDREYTIHDTYTYIISQI